jgi:hypothetical protein
VLARSAIAGKAPGGIALAAIALPESELLESALAGSALVESAAEARIKARRNGGRADMTWGWSGKSTRMESSRTLEKISGGLPPSNSSPATLLETIAARAAGRARTATLVRVRTPR